MRADRGTATREGGGYNGYGIALSPMQNDLLALGVKADGEEGYNMHEIPMVDGESVGRSRGRSLSVSLSRDILGCNSMRRISRSIKITVIFIIFFVICIESRPRSKLFL